MAKNRYINTKFWDDSYVVNLDPIEKLLFIYLITNPLTSICGIYEISLRRIAFDTGIDKDMVLKIFDRLSKDGKILYKDGWLAIRNFIKHQRQSENEKDKINIGIQKALDKAPENLKSWLKKGLQGLTRPLNYSNLNLNLNTKSNTNKKAISPMHLGILQFWNSQKIIQHKSITNQIEKALIKTLKDYSIDQVKQGITHFGIIINDLNYFYKYKWGLATFLNRKGGFPLFLNDGEKWIAYQDEIKIKSAPTKTPKQIQSDKITDIKKQHTDETLAEIEKRKKALGIKPREQKN